MSKRNFLDFEQPIAELENKIEELRYVQTESAVDISDEIDQLSKKSLQLTKDIYSNLRSAIGLDKKEPVKKAKGGKVGSASKRGDGIAQRGKTRGRMV